MRAQIRGNSQLNFTAVPESAQPDDVGDSTQSIAQTGELQKEVKGIDLSGVYERAEETLDPDAKQEEKVPLKGKKKKQNKQNKQKPAWAMTAEQTEEQEEHEVKELLDFAKTLDFD